MAKVIIKKKYFKKGILSVAMIISLILILIFLGTIKTASLNDAPTSEVLTIIDADPDPEDKELIADAIKMSRSPMNVNSNEYISYEID